MVLEVWVDLIHQLYFKLCKHCLIIKVLEKNKVLENCLNLICVNLCEPWIYMFTGFRYIIFSGTIGKEYCFKIM